MNYFNSPGNPYHNLGFIPPFYRIKEGKIICNNDLHEILHGMEMKPELDPVAVIEILSTLYCFADRTLIKGIQRTPWLAHPDENNEKWVFNLTDKPNDQISSEALITRKLYDLLSREIIEAVQGHNRIGILVTGGMDSRIIAGITSNLLVSGVIDVEIVGITWGKSGSRDVAYAERICKILGWEWIQIELSPEDLKANIQLTAELGCEYPPQHLHALPSISKMKNIDCLFVATYGDSIGRAVFSGRHINKLVHLKSAIRNPFALINDNVYKESLISIDSDLDHYHGLNTSLESHQYIHYLRRMLNPVFIVLNGQMTVHHAFASRQTYEFIWSLDPGVRFNNIYNHLLDYINPGLSKIPWAKTGRNFNSESGKPDMLSLKYHDYYDWIHRDIYPYIEDHIYSGLLEDLGIFNFRNIESLLKRFRKTENLKEPVLCQIISWLASLSIFCDKYDISTSVSNISSPNKLHHRIKCEYDIFRKSARNIMKKILN